MDRGLTLDFASSIRYALTPRPAPGDAVEIVLDLFHGAAPALTRTIASVRPVEAAPLLARCRRHLERLGAHAVVQAEAERPSEADAWTAPAWWVFAG